MSHHIANEWGKWTAQSQHLDAAKVVELAGRFRRRIQLQHDVLTAQWRIRSPNAAWIELSPWEALTLEEREGFCPLYPDFVVELRSPSDFPKTLLDKMNEYIDNGARLGWLIDPKVKQVEIYRPATAPGILTAPRILSGESVLKDLHLNLASIWT